MEAYASMHCDVHIPSVMKTEYSDSQWPINDDLIRPIQINVFTDKKFHYVKYCITRCAHL